MEKGERSGMICGKGGLRCRISCLFKSSMYCELKVRHAMYPQWWINTTNFLPFLLLSLLSSLEERLSSRRYFPRTSCGIFFRACWLSVVSTVTLVITGNLVGARYNDFVIYEKQLICILRIFTYFTLSSRPLPPCLPLPFAKFISNFSKFFFCLSYFGCQDIKIIVKYFSFFDLFFLIQKVKRGFLVFFLENI